MTESARQVEYGRLDLENVQELRRLREIVDYELSEPYSNYVYRYFVNQWPELTLVAREAGSQEIVGCIMGKLESHRGCRSRGYIGMLAVTPAFRRRGIARALIERFLSAVGSCDEVVLETEASNRVALQLYEQFGFVRVKRMYRYYLNEGDAFKLILPMSERSTVRSAYLSKIHR